MITLDTSTFIVLLLAAALGGALIGLLPAWRRLMAGAKDLPVWGFLGRRGVRLERFSALRAVLRCEVCDSKPQCRRLLAECAQAPAHCPNAELFAAPSCRLLGAKP